MSMFPHEKRKSRKRGANGMASRKLLLQRLSAELAATKRTCEALVAEQQQSKYTEQVLVDTILQLDEVISFKRHVEALQQQDVQASSTTNSRYVTQLLSRVTPEQVQAILTWSPDAWTQAFTEAMTPLPMLLDVVRREDEPAGDQAAYLPIAEQQLNEAVDRYVTIGVLGCVYLETVGGQLGACAATNFMTQQLVAPTDQHWRHVAERMQLTQVQLQQLTAGYHTFQQHQKLKQKAQLAVAQLVDSPNCCSVQLLAAAKEAGTTTSNSHSWDVPQQPGAAAAVVATSDSTQDSHLGVLAGASGSACAAKGTTTQWFDGAETHAEAASALAGRVASTLSVAGRDGHIPAAAPSAAAADAHADELHPEEEDPITLVNELMALLNRSSVAIHLLLFNTLTHRQLACMVVASYPYLPRAGPLIEAATADLEPSLWLEEQSPEAVAAAAAAAATTREAQLSWQFSQERAAQLSQQCCKWWHD